MANAIVVVGFKLFSNLGVGRTRVVFDVRGAVVDHEYVNSVQIRVRGLGHVSMFFFYLRDDF